MKSLIDEAKKEEGIRKTFYLPKLIYVKFKLKCKKNEVRESRIIATLIKRFLNDE